MNSEITLQDVENLIKASKTELDNHCTSVAKYELKSTLQIIIALQAIGPSSIV